MHTVLKYTYAWYQYQKFLLTRLLQHIATFKINYYDAWTSLNIHTRMQEYRWIQTFSKLLFIVHLHVRVFVIW